MFTRVFLEFGSNLVASLLQQDIVSNNNGSNQFKLIVTITIEYSCLCVCVCVCVCDN